MGWRRGGREWEERGGEGERNEGKVSKVETQREMRERETQL